MDKLKHACDALAACGIITTLVGWLPAIAAGLSAIWYIIRIYEWWKGKKNGD
jgi:hypothetical protein